MSLFTLGKGAHTARGVGALTTSELRSRQGGRARPGRNPVDSHPSPSSAPKLFPPNPPVIPTYAGGLWVITRGITASWARGQQRPCSQPARPASRTHQLSACRSGQGVVGTGDPARRLGPGRRPGVGVGCGRGPLGARGAARSSCMGGKLWHWVSPGPRGLLGSPQALACVRSFWGGQGGLFPWSLSSPPPTLTEKAPRLLGLPQAQEGPRGCH